MSDMDVSLRLRLQNQLSRPAKEAKDDLNDVKAAAERLGRTKAGNLDQELNKLGRSATDTKGKIGAIGSEADQLKQKISRIDDGAFAGLKSDAAAAKQAINEIGNAADRTEQKLKTLRSAGARAGQHAPSAPYRSQPGPRVGDGVFSAAEGMVDQFGFPVAIGAGIGYAAGAFPAAALVGAGVVVNAAAGDEQRSDALRASGGYNAEQQKKFDEIMGRAGARRGVGTAGAQGVFGVLQAGGLSSEDAAAMTDNALKFSVGTKADPNDAANMTIALRNIMGIDANKMRSAYDAIAVGGNSGSFEIKDMAKNFPSIFARMAARGSSGMLGVRTAAAMSQPIAGVSGNSDQAATAFEAMLDDLAASDVRERGLKYGFDTWGEMDAAKARGEDPVLGVLKRIGEVFGKNREGFADVFRNNTAVPAIVAVTDNIKKIEALVNKMDGASGVVDESYGVNTDNLNSQKDRLFATIGKRLKDGAAPALPFLTKVVKATTDALEQQEQQREVKANQDRVFGLMFSQLPKQGAVPPWKRFMFGDAADTGFDLKDKLGISLRPSAETSMQGYREGLLEQGKQAEGDAMGIADRLRSILNFNVSPTITPQLVPPGSPAPAASGKQSYIQPSSIRLNQTITSPNPQHAALRAQRLQERGIRQAQARSFADTGRRLA